MQIKTIFSIKEHTDSGLALLLILLIAGVWLKSQPLYVVAIAEIIFLLIAPVIVYPFTFLWLNISMILGGFMSKIILILVFFIFVWPMGMLRRMLKKDTLLLKRFKKGEVSVFSERNHTFTANDFTTPY
jgi:hypothetical protein